MRWPLVWRSRFDALQVECDLLRAQQLYMVDREAFNLLVDERDRLVTQNADLLNHVRRIDRVEHGLTEEERKKREVLDDMPYEMKRYISKYRSPTREYQEKLAWDRRKKGEPWADIWAEYQAK